MRGELQGRTIAVLATTASSPVERTQPVKARKQAGE